MKIDTSPEHYKIMNLTEISDTVSDMKNRCCIQLSEMGECLKVILNAAHEAFITVNYDETEQHVEHFNLTVKNLQIELEELLKSANELAEKIGHKWS